jgi:CheY-like chemotaxis protein
MQSILVAIDDPVISMLLSEELFEEGYSVKTIPDPWTLVQAIQKDCSTLLVIDEFFGGGKGIDLCLGFRKHLIDSRVVVWASWISVLGRKKKKFPPNFHILKTHTLQELTREICRRMTQLRLERAQEKPPVSECLLGR